MEDARKVSMPNKCPLCNLGKLERVSTVGLIQCDPDTNKLLFELPSRALPLGKVETTPAHVIGCKRCGYMFLLSAGKVTF